jgi:hypothetical protein
MILVVVYRSTPRGAPTDQTVPKTFVLLLELIPYECRHPSLRFVEELVVCPTGDRQCKIVHAQFHPRFHNAMGLIRAVQRWVSVRALSSSQGFDLFSQIGALFAQTIDFVGHTSVDDLKGFEAVVTFASIVATIVALLERIVVTALLMLTQIGQLCHCFAAMDLEIAFDFQFVQKIDHNSGRRAQSVASQGLPIVGTGLVLGQPLADAVLTVSEPTTGADNWIGKYPQTYAALELI